MTAVYSVELDEKRHPVMVKECEVLDSVISCPQDAVSLFQTAFHAGSKAEEHMFMLSLDVHKKVLGLFIVCHGQIGQCAVSAREIFLRALISGASSIILAHNHPSGTISPSVEDFAFTQQINKAGELLGVQLDDSIILSANGYYSFIEAGQLT